jgi:hypothetical protein
MGYCPMPFYPVVRAIRTKTKGRVFLPNGQAVGPVTQAENEQLLTASGIVCAEDLLPEKKRGDELLEGKVPLYLEVTVAP